MGWSIDLYRQDLNAVFKGLGKQYAIQHIESTTPGIMIKHEGEIPQKTMEFIVKMFPEFVYVNFVPNSTFPIGSSITETH